MNLFLFSFKIAALITAMMAFILVIAGTPRLWSMWRRLRLVTLSLPCQDPANLHLRLGQALKFIGQPTSLQADGSFTVEPSNWRKKFGITPVTVAYPQTHMALITGQSAILKGFAGREGVQLSPVPNSSFGLFLKPWSKRLYWFLGIAFIALFLAIFLVDPNHIAARTHAAAIHTTDTIRTS